jgi:hypothetical protein
MKMKKLALTSIIGLIMTIALGFGFIPAAEQKAYCAECDTDTTISFYDIYKTFDEECEKKKKKGEERNKALCFTFNIYNEIFQTMKTLAGDNRFGPGDRILFVGSSQNGNLLAGANRTFQSGIPLDKDSLTVEVSKTDGRNGAIVKICTVDENGVFKRVGTINFPEDNDTGTKSAIVTGVKGKLVRISVESFGSAAKTFKYTLKTRQ